MIYIVDNGERFNIGPFLQGNSLDPFNNINFVRIGHGATVTIGLDTERLSGFVRYSRPPSGSKLSPVQPIRIKGHTDGHTKSFEGFRYPKSKSGYLAFKGGSIVSPAYVLVKLFGITGHRRFRTDSLAERTTDVVHISDSFSFGMSKLTKAQRATFKEHLEEKQYFGQ